MGNSRRPVRTVRRPRWGLGTQITLALSGAALLVCVLMYVAVGLGTQDWGRWNEFGSTYDWSNASRIALPGAALIAAVVGAVLGSNGHSAKLEELRLDRDANLTDRYQKATEMLASGTEVVKMGGIYSLGRVSLESEQDRVGIVKLLESVAASQLPEKTNPFLVGPNEEVKVPYNREVAAIVQTLGRIRAGAGLVHSRESDNCAHVNDNMTFNAAGANLRGLDLSGLALCGVAFENADLHLADLQGSCLRGASFLGADLSGADLSEANLCDANFANATLFKTQFRAADLSYAWLSWAQEADEAYFQDAIMLGTFVGDGTLSSELLSERQRAQADFQSNTNEARARELQDRLGGSRNAGPR